MMCIQAGNSQQVVHIWVLRQGNDYWRWGQHGSTFQRNVVDIGDTPDEKGRCIHGCYHFVPLRAEGYICVNKQ